MSRAGRKVAGSREIVSHSLLRDDLKTDPKLVLDLNHAPDAYRFDLEIGLLDDGAAGVNACLSFYVHRDCLRHAV